MDFDKTFDDLYPPLVRYCQRLTGERDVAEDIAQEAMIRLYTHEVEGPVQGLKAWVFRTATHLIRDRYRVNENRRRLLQENPVTPEAPENPQLKLERGEARALARNALDVLPQRDREILLMRYEGFSYKEIAEAVDVAATSVGTLLARAEQRFSSALGAEATS